MDIPAEHFCSFWIDHFPVLLLVVSKNYAPLVHKLQQELFRGGILILCGWSGWVTLTSANHEPSPHRFVSLSTAKKQAVTDSGGTLRQSKAEQAGLYQLLECLPAMQPRAFHGSLSLQQETGMPEQKWPAIQFALPDIAKACNQFYGASLEAELTLLRKRGYIDKTWSQRFDILMSQGWLSEALEENSAFLLRVGRHSGAESVTLNGLRDIKIMKGRGEKPDYLDHAKTLWLVGDERQLQTNLLPFGWMLVEPFIDPSELPDWPEQVEDKSIHQWRLEIDQRQNKEKELMRKQVETARLEQEEAQRLKAEEEAAEQARQQDEAKRAAQARAAFDALSDNRKTAYRLNELAEALKAQPESMRDPSEVNRLLNEIKGEAQNWNDSGERESLAVFMDDYYDLIGWYKPGVKADKKKKQGRKKRDLIAKIRAG